MAETNRLLKRKNVWYYRRRVPLHLVSKAGKKFIQVSLDTTSLVEAKKRRSVLDLEWDARLDAFENSDENAVANEVADKPALALVELVRRYVERIDHRSAQQLLKDGPVDLAEQQAMQMDNELELQALTTPEDTHAAEWVYLAGQRVLKDSDVSVADGLSASQSAEIVRRGLMEIARRKSARLRDDFSTKHYDHLFDPDRPAEVLFGDLAKQHLAMKLEEAEANSQSTKWTEKVTSHVALIREIVGDNTPVGTIDFDASLRVRSVLAQLPANRTKIYPKLSLEKAIEQGKKDGRTPMAFITQTDYLRTFKDILDLGCLKRLLPNNPAASLQPLKKDQVALDKKRMPFSELQVRGVLTSAFYQQCAVDAPKPYSKPDRDWRFWLPLICALMGMRPLEVCQLLVGDIHKTPKGTDFIDVVETADEGENIKTLKTSASRRKIPIHPELIKIGFLNFVEKRRSQVGEKERLFAHLKPDAYGNSASYPMKRFRDHFLPAAITLQPRQSFYSFRHSFRDALRRCEAPSSALKALGGWTEAKAVSDHYGTVHDPDHQAQWIAKVAYEDLDFTFLHGAYS